MTKRKHLPLEDHIEIGKELDRIEKYLTKLRGTLGVEYGYSDPTVGEAFLNTIIHKVHKLQHRLDDKVCKENPRGDVLNIYYPRSND